jgi:hypothetical protein
MTRHFRDDRDLGRLLRAGDPAGDGRDPDQTELQTWRRNTLIAVAGGHGEVSRRTRLLPFVAAAAAVVLAAIFFLVAERPAPISPAPQVAVSPPPALPEAVSPVAEQAPLLGTTPRPPRVAAVAATPAGAAVPAAASRTVHFTAPGGTRVIWTLNPDLQLHLHGGSS